MMLSDVQQAALAMVARAPDRTCEELAKLIGIGTSTLRPALRALVVTGDVIRAGNTRGTTYTVTRPTEGLRRSPSIERKYGREFER